MMMSGERKTRAVADTAISMILSKPGMGIFYRYVGLVADRTGLEPATSAVTGRHSNQLNYRSALNQKPFFKRMWWVLQGSNLRPTPCKGVALPTELNTHKKRRRIVTIRGIESSGFHTQVAEFPILFVRTQPLAGIFIIGNFLTPFRVTQIPLNCFIHTRLKCLLGLPA